VVTRTATTMRPVGHGDISPFTESSQSAGPMQRPRPNSLDSLDVLLGDSPHIYSCRGSQQGNSPVHRTHSQSCHTLELNSDPTSTPQYRVGQIPVTGMPDEEGADRPISGCFNPPPTASSPMMTGMASLIEAMTRQGLMNKREVATFRDNGPGVASAAVLPLESEAENISMMGFRTADSSARLQTDWLSFPASTQNAWHFGGEFSQPGSASNGSAAEPTAPPHEDPLQPRRIAERTQRTAATLTPKAPPKERTMPLANFPDTQKTENSTKGRSYEPDSMSMQLPTSSSVANRSNPTSGRPPGRTRKLEMQLDAHADIATDAISQPKPEDFGGASATSSSRRSSRMRNEVDYRDPRWVVDDANNSMSISAPEKSFVVPHTRSQSKSPTKNGSIGRKPRLSSGNTRSDAVSPNAPLPSWTFQAVGPDSSLDGNESAPLSIANPHPMHMVKHVPVRAKGRAVHEGLGKSSLFLSYRTRSHAHKGVWELGSKRLTLNWSLRSSARSKVPKERSKDERYPRIWAEVCYGLCMTTETVTGGLRCRTWTLYAPYTRVINEGLPGH
jgi:hypothetical protein